MTRHRTLAIVLAALACGVATVALVLSSDHLEATTVWAVFGPAVLFSFVGTGLYAGRKRPESRVGTLMVVFGFAWFAAVVGVSDNAWLYSLGLLSGGLWGGVFLQLVLTFPSGRIQSARDRTLVVAGYLTFTIATVPAMLVAAPQDFGCDSCPANVLLIDRNETLANIALGLNALLYAVLFVIVLIRLARRWWRTPTLERLQLTPVYASGMLTFLLVTVGMAGAGDAALWPAFAATALLPLAFLAGLLRSHVARLDAELRARMEDLRASRVRIVEAGDTERQRLERNLHDGAQARLVGLAYLLGQARRSADTQPDEIPGILDDALKELKLSLSELRELARGIHPAVLTERGLDAAVYALASRSPVPVELESQANGTRLPEQVEIAAYFAVAEALANVAKYAQATGANVAICRENGKVTVDVTDDGIGGADRSRGSGLRGVADRVAALDGTLHVDSPPGQGTHLRVEIPLGAPKA